MIAMTIIRAPASRTSGSLRRDASRSLALTLYELATYNDANVIVAGRMVWASATVLGEIQLTRRLGLFVGSGAGTRIVKSEVLDPESSFGVSLTLLVAFRKWDFSGGGSLGNLAGDPTTSLSFGFSKRWGL